MIRQLASSARATAQPALVELAQRNLAFEAPPSMLAWDLGRLINICRWCFDAGMLGEQECWQYVLPAAETLQAEYGSWRELSIGYLLGFLAWKGAEPDAEFGILTYNHNLMLKDPRSPWRQLAWSTPLA